MTFQAIHPISPLATASTMSTSKQEAYAQNLGGTTLGFALYHPIPMSQTRGRVGDIGFLNPDGTYQWLANAFDLAVFHLSREFSEN